MGKRFDNFCYDFVKVTGAIPAFFWLKPKVIYIGKKQRYKGGLIIASNHTGVTDPVLICFALWYRRPRFLATKEIFYNKLSSMFFHRLGIIPIDREIYDVGAIRNSIETLNKNRCLTIFPEGHIERENIDNDFKSGVILISYFSNKETLPVHIIKPTKWYQRHVILIGDLIDIKELVGENPNQETFAKAAKLLEVKQNELYQKYLERNNKRNKNEQIFKVHEQENV